MFADRILIYIGRILIDRFLKRANKKQKWNTFSHIILLPYPPSRFIQTRINKLEPLIFAFLWSLHCSLESYWFSKERVLRIYIYTTLQFHSNSGNLVEEVRCNVISSAALIEKPYDALCRSRIKYAMQSPLTQFNNRTSALHCILIR